MTRAQVSTIALIALLTTLPALALAGDVILSGTVTSAVGEKMGGVTVSAKAEGQTITTSVFTDEAGGYYFPPLTSGKYRVWAQALSYETAKSTIDLSAAKRQDFVLKPAKEFFPQLPGDVMLASLPGDTPDDFRMKTQVRKKLHRLPHCELSPAAQVRRDRLERHPRADEAAQRVRPLS